MNAAAILAIVAAALVGVAGGVLAARRGAGQGLNIRDAIGVVLIGAFIGVLGILFWKSIPPSNEQLIVYMLGQLSGFVSAVVALHYVTKAGEKELDAKRAENTGDALAAVREAISATPASELADRPTGAPGDPVHTVEEGK